MHHDRSCRPRQARAISTLLLYLFVMLIVAPSISDGARLLGATRPSGMDTLPRDPALTIGTLPNGMHYYIRVNKTPAHRAVLRLAVDAGSVLEDEDQRGFAHFLEHMAFNGTKHFPRHALIDYLQTAGMRFGADINASTSFDETIFMLEVPTDDEKSLRKGLTVMEDWAGGGMTIDSSEVLAERGVVMGEWRSYLRDTLSQRVQAHHDSVLYGNSRYRTRATLGSTKLIQAAEPSPIRRFYHDWYRPELMAIVAVGDFDKAQVEREIRERFGAIPAMPHGRPRVRTRLPSTAMPVVDVYRSLVNPGIVAYWKTPSRPVATQAAFRLQLVDQLMLEYLQQRLLLLRQQEQHPFFAAEIGRGALTRTTDAYVVHVSASPDSLMSGFEAVLAEIERVALHGVPPRELEFQKESLLRQLESTVDVQGAQPSADFASAYVEHDLGGNGSLLVSASQKLDLVKAILPSVTAGDLARAAAFWHRRSDLTVQVDWFAYSHEALPSRQSVLAVLDAASHAHLAVDNDLASNDTPLLATLPAPGRIVHEEEDAGAGITKWTLSNGARVLLKPTAVNADELLIDARSPGGSSLLPDSLFFSPGRLVAQIMTQAAGLGGRDRSSIAQQLSTTGLREFAVSLSTTDEAISLGGSPRDLEMLMQLLHLQFTAPKLDATALAIWKQVGTGEGSYSADDRIAGLLSGGNPRLAPPSLATVPLADTGSAMTVYRDRFGNAGDFTFTFVGAFKLDQMRPLVERYVASLPSTAKREQAKDLGVRPYNHKYRSTTKVFDVPKASTQLMFEGLFPSTPDQYVLESQRLDAVAWALRIRFTDLLREQIGGTYGVAVRARTRAEPQEHFLLGISYDAAPAMMNMMIDTTFAVIEDVRKDGATPHELEQILAMQRRSWENALQDNHYWLNTIEMYDRLQIPFRQIVEPPQPVTVQDLRAAAQQFLHTDAYIQMTAVPRDSVKDVRSDSTKPTTKKVAGQR